MRWLLVLSIITTGCAAKDHIDESVSHSPVCLQDLTQTYMVQYPDGVTRDSMKFTCSDGCRLYYWATDPVIHFKECQ